MKYRPKHVEDTAQPPATYRFTRVTLDEVIERLAPPGPASLAIVRSPGKYSVVVDYHDAGLRIVESNDVVTVTVAQP